MSEQQNSQIRLSPNEELPQNRTRRALSRSPHPYHRQRAELPHATLRPSSTFPAFSPRLHSKQYTDDEGSGGSKSLHRRYGSPEKSTESDSGTEADDEHFLKGLPAPRWRPHKGLRGGDGTYSGSPSPLISPAVLSEEGGRVSDYMGKGPTSTKWPYKEDIRKTTEKYRRKRRAEVGRRVTEVALLVAVGSIVISSQGVLLEVRSWKKEVLCLIVIAASLVALYPLRLIIYLTSGRSNEQWPSLKIPASFDPAPLLYPPALTIFVTLILSVSSPAALLPNIILSISALPLELIPAIDSSTAWNSLHWFISCLPIFLCQRDRLTAPKSALSDAPAETLDPEVLILLYPLHQALCVTLRFLTTTSLLRAELQLLSIALINVLLLSTSPQAVILKALLWVGGVGMLISCTHVLRWVVTLARVPRWRFRKASNRGKRSLSPGFGIASIILNPLNSVLGIGKEATEDSSDEDIPEVETARMSPNLKLDVRNLNRMAKSTNTGHESQSAIEPRPESTLPAVLATAACSFTPSLHRRRRHTLPNGAQPDLRSNQWTPSGRRKRSASSSVQSLSLLTEQQAAVRKWIYAIYIYLCVISIIFLIIRPYVGTYALDGSEPIGWALGYLFGDLSWFRMEVMTANLELWIMLPERQYLGKASCHLGWVEHLRQSTFGTGNVRLMLCAYWLSIIISGLAIVFRLSAIYEVDTRRKVFHFMMVGMLLPATFIDPAFAALALSIILAIFLLLDLFRASQLPPLSKPLAYFLTPYVDGRDLRGPVVISHIFLLIGSAIPLWLSLATLSRTGKRSGTDGANASPWAGWDLPTRDISMVSGVICVGMGDAAASLIGRRYGRHKWFWSGGKSVEGSMAFGVAVWGALVAAKAWLRVGGWVDGSAGYGAGENGAFGAINSTELESYVGWNDWDTWKTTAQKAGIAAALASLTEAVLTGGNDNVVVPVVLWVCVKGLGI